ncbi:MAG: aspartate kinase [Anaerolineae bacterium]|nr:aspartate kinase [Anaerolineae bacterium]
MKVVMKFGGTSVGSAERIAQVAEIVRNQTNKGNRVVVVLSAMSGVTNTLLGALKDAANGNMGKLLQTRDELLKKHLDVINTLVKNGTAREQLAATTTGALDRFEDLCSSIYVLGEITPRATDAVGSLGERLIVPITAQAFNDCGIKSQWVGANELILTDDNFVAASPLMQETREQTRAKLLPVLDAGAVVVTTGFIGATKKGIITTLGRGGRDYTATIIGAAIDANEVQIWTDVNGVMTTDPRIVPEAITLSEISYGEAAELSYFGAKVIHPKTILPVAEKNTPIRILNSFEPTHPGTLIVREPRSNGSPIRGITAIRNVSLVTVEGRGMQGVPGMAARVFSSVARENISVLMFSQSSSEQNICLVIESQGVLRAVRELEHEFTPEIIAQNIERVWAQDKIAIIAVVGSAIKTTPGIAARVFGALAEQSINVIAIAQGSSEYNLSLVVDESDADNAVRAIHRSIVKR